MKSLLAALVLLPTFALAQATDPIRVSLDARGEDVREVLATVFAQAHKPYALDASIKGKLYVTLNALPYAKALDIVLAQANLVAKEKDGVLMITPAPVPVAKTAPTAPVKKTAPAKTEAKPAPLSPLTYNHKVTTRLTKAPLADVFAELGKQAGTTIEVDSSVPEYRVDAFFVKTSLKYALNRLCKAAGLRYTAIDGKIVVELNKA